MKTVRIIFGLLVMVMVASVLAAVNAGPAWGVLLAIGPVAAAAIKSSKELKEQRSTLLDQMQGILDKAKEEKRDLSAEDNTAVDDLNKKVEDLNIEIQRMERMEANMAIRAKDFINKSNEENEKKEVQNYSFLRAIRCAMPGGKLDGLEREMHDEAKREASASGITIEGVGIPGILLRKSEKRDMTASTGSSLADGGVLVPTMLQPGFIDTLAAKMVLVEMGAQFLTGLVGNVDIARKTSTTAAAWEGENDAGAEASPQWDKITLSPNRLGAYIQLSKRLINQTSNSAEKIAQDDIERAIRLAVETEAIVGTVTSGGILATAGIGSVVGGTTGLAVAWSHVVDLEKEVAIDDADIGTLGYLTNPKVRGKLKQTALGTNLPYIMAPGDQTLNGYKLGVSTLVPSTLDKGASTGVCSAMIFGNFSDLLIANWAGLDVVVDPYTDAKTSLVNIIVNSWWDVAVRRAVSFAAMKDILTA